MIVDPALRALRGDAASQRHAHEAMAAAKAGWEKRYEAPLGELEAYGRGAPLEDCAQLAAVFDTTGQAAAMADGLMAAMLGAMREAPLGQVPLQHSYAQGACVLQLANSGRAALSLVTMEGDARHPRPPARSVCFTDNERHEIALKGLAKTRIVTLHGNPNGAAKLSFEPSDASAGTVTRLIGQRMSRIVDCVPTGHVALRLTRTAAAPAPTREYRIEDGTLLHQASGCRDASALAMMVETLGRMKHAPAAPALEALACDRNPRPDRESANTADPALRWQALRECLALDTARGFAALCVAARNPSDPLQPSAAELHRQLLASHPQLSALEDEPCHA